MQAWQRDKARADIFIPASREILARLFIREAPPELDQRRNADFVFWIAGRHCGTRVRNIASYYTADEYGVLYGDQITFRFSRPSGVPTEFDKLLAGEGHHFLFAWGDYQTGAIGASIVLDLQPLRGWLTRMAFQGTRPYRLVENRDGTVFAVIAIADIPRDCIRSHEPLPLR